MTAIDPTPEQELASSYLDGDVTAVERARVDASPELRALVASMRDAKTLMAVRPVGDAVRDAAIASALAEFDGVGNVVSLDSRRRWPSRVLAAAAAVVLLGVVGITVFQNSSDDKSESASRGSEPKFEANTADTAAAGAVPEGAGDQVLSAMAPPIVIDDPEQLRDLTVPSPTGAPPDADDGGETTAADSQHVESYNVEALACMEDDQVFLADILYKGAVAIAVRDTVTGVTEAIDSTCTVLARVIP